MVSIGCKAKSPAAVAIPPQINKSIVYRKDLSSGAYIQLTPGSVSYIYIYKDIIYGKGADNNKIYTISLTGNSWTELKSPLAKNIYTSIEMPEKSPNIAQDRPRMAPKGPQEGPR